MKYINNPYKLKQKIKILLLMQFVLWLLSIPSIGLGQTTLWSETFESTNSLTLVNNATNYWSRGTLTQYAGSYSLYIRNSAGYQYTITTTQVSHAYRDITIPAGATNVSLSFYWKGYGESTYDFIRVYADPSMTAPVAGSYPTGTQLGQYNQSSAFSQATINLSAYAGSTIRLIFTWRNDASIGTQPPAAIDNILLTYTPCSGTVSISGPTLACSSTSISYTATPSGFAGTPTYQWYCNGSALGISGGGSAPLYSSYSGGISQTLNVVTFAGTYSPVNWYCVASYGGCTVTSNTISLSVPETTPAAPTAGAHTPSQTQIIWNWNAVSGATGYKWSTTNNYSTAINVGTNLSRTETGLTCNTAYTRYVWAYKVCGYSAPTTLSATTSACCITPAVTNMSASICSGASFSVTPVNGTNGTVPVGTTYSWLAPSVPGISGTAAGTNAASISGTLANSTGSSINVVYTVTPKSGTCTGATFTVTVSVLPLPTASISPNPVPQFCYGNSQTLTASTGCGSPSYLWYRNGVSTGVTTPTYAATTPGLYSARVTCSGCSNTSAPVTVVVQSSSFLLNVNQPANSGLSIGDYVWSGNTSTNWHVATNWLVYIGAGVFSVASVIPDSTKNVVIRSYAGCASNLCNILSGNTGRCKSITIESSLTMNLVSYLEVARNWTNTLGTFNPGTGTVTFNGQTNTTSTIYTGGTGAGKQFYNVSLNGAPYVGIGNVGSKVNLEGNIRINNNFVLTEGYQFNVNSGSTMSIGGNFTHNGCQFNRGLGSVTLTGTGKLIDGTASTYFRILNISGSYTLTEPNIYLWSNPAGDYGDLNILPGGSLNATNKTIHIDGSWTNNGTFTAGTSTVSFEVAYDQFIFSGGSKFYNFTVNRTTTPPYVTITDPAWITANGNFLYGVVNFSGTGSLTFEDNATTNGGDFQSFVNGPVIKKGNENFLFPLGDVTAIAPWAPHVWAPLAIANTTGATSDQFTCEYFFVAAPNNYDPWNICNYSVDLHHVSGVEYWELNRNAGTSVPWVTLYYKNATRSGILNPSSIVEAHWENCPSTGTNLWVSKGGTPVEDIVGIAGHVTNAIPFPNFSPVTFGTIQDNNPLPVSLLNFSAICRDAEITIQWSTASEANNDYFTVQRSIDSSNWELLKSIPGGGNSNTLLLYSVSDPDPFNGVSYYRLIQTDFDGHSETFSPVVVMCNDQYDVPGISYYPNPLNSEVVVDMQNLNFKIAVLKIYDILGKVVYKKTLYSNDSENQKVTLDLQSLAPGVYSAEFFSDNYSNISKIVKN